MEFIIEKAKADDAKAILDFTRKCGSETDNLSFGSEGIPISSEEEATFLKSVENSDTGIFLVARKETEIIATANYTVYAKKRMSHRGELGISVLKKYWNCGIGTRLLNSILDFAKNTAKSEIVSLEVRSDNIAAIHIYEKFGFKKIGTFKGFFKINGELIDYDILELCL